MHVVAAPIEQVDRARLAELRGSPNARRAAGSFYTDDDVARHLARRALGGSLLDALDCDVDRIDDQLANGEALVEIAVDRARRDESSQRCATTWIRSVRVLDPSCGAGSFLVAAWSVLGEIAAALDAPGADTSQLIGIDVDPGAIDACRSMLLHHAGTDAARLVVADATMAGVLPEADVVLGNPPFVRARPDEHAVGDLATSTVGNLSAWIVERALEAAVPRARVTFVLPISTICTDAFGPARDVWSRCCDVVFASHFDTIPSTLFTDVVQRISILEGRVGAQARARPAAGRNASWFTTRYHRWMRHERDALLHSIRFTRMPRHTVGGSLAKVGTDVEHELLDAVFAHPPAARWFSADPQPDNRIRYKRRWSYFLLFCDFVPPVWNEDGSLREPSELKSIEVEPSIDACALIAVYSSTLFWWYFSVFTDNRNVNRRDLAAFPVPEFDADAHVRLARLGGDLMVALRECAEVRTCTYRSVGTIRNTYFRQAATRPILDAIDEVLAAAYGLTDAQRDFVLGFERRFRS